VPDARRTLAANTLYSGIGVYADYAAAFVVSIVIARRLGPEDYGTYTLLMWVVLVGVSLANNGITTGVMKFVGECRGARSGGLAEGVLRYLERLQVTAAVAVCGASGIVLVFAADAVSRGLHTAPMLAWLLPPAVLARSLYLFYFAGAKGFENFQAGALVHACVAPINVFLVVVVSYVVGTVNGFVYAYVSVSLLYMAAMRLALFRRIGEEPANLPDALVGRIYRHIRYASAIVALDLVVLRQTEIFFLNRFSPPADIAYYGLGRSLSASAMLLVPGVLTALLVPVMSRTFGEDPALLGRRFLAATRYIVILVVPVVALCELYAGDLVTALYGAAYSPAVPVFRVTVAVSAIGVVSASASSYQLGTDRHPAIVLMMTMVAMVTLILDYLLIRSLGLAGAIAAGAVGSLLLGVVLLWHARRTLGVSFEWPAYMRVLGAGAVSTLPAIALRYLLPVWLALPIGVILVVTIYAALSVVLRTWTRQDLQSMGAMTDALPRWLEAPVGSFLRRAADATPMSDERP